MNAEAAGAELSQETREAQEFFHRKIPLTRAMGVRVVQCDDDALAVEAPVALNYNHHHTAFGGSINAVATLAGYGILWLELRSDSRAQLVISDSSIRFLRPVRETIRAVCRRPAAEELQRFQETLRARGRAALTLRVQVVEHGTIAAEFTGTFVARVSSSGG